MMNVMNMIKGVAEAECLLRDEGVLDVNAYFKKPEVHVNDTLWDKLSEGKLIVEIDYDERFVRRQFTEDGVTVFVLSHKKEAKNEKGIDA